MCTALGRVHAVHCVQYPVYRCHEAPLTDDLVHAMSWSLYTGDEVSWRRVQSQLIAV